MKVIMKYKHSDMSHENMYLEYSSSYKYFTYHRTISFHFTQVLCIIYWPKLWNSMEAWLSRFAKRIKRRYWYYVILYKKNIFLFTWLCCGRYYTENMHISHTEIIVITVKCPLMEFANDFVGKVFPRVSTVYSVCFFNIHFHCTTI